MIAMVPVRYHCVVLITILISHEIECEYSNNYSLMLNATQLNKLSE